MSIEELNRKFKEGIQNLDYCIIQTLITQNKKEFLDPTLLHYAVQVCQIDIVAILVENRNVKQNLM